MLPDYSASSFSLKFSSPIRAWVSGPFSVFSFFFSPKIILFISRSSLSIYSSLQHLQIFGEIIIPKSSETSFSASKMHEVIDWTAHQWNEEITENEENEKGEGNIHWHHFWCRHQRMRLPNEETEWENYLNRINSNQICFYCLLCFSMRYQHFKWITSSIA